MSERSPLQLMELSLQILKSPSLNTDFFWVQSPALNSVFSQPLPVYIVILFELSASYACLPRCHPKAKVLSWTSMKSGRMRMVVGTEVLLMQSYMLYAAWGTWGPHSALKRVFNQQVWVSRTQRKMKVDAERAGRGPIAIHRFLMHWQKILEQTYSAWGAFARALEQTWFQAEYTRLTFWAKDQQNSLLKSLVIDLTTLVWRDKIKQAVSSSVVDNMWLSA